MSIQFSGGPITTSTFAGATTSALIAGIQAALTASNWTVISGGGTTNLLMQTVNSPQNMQMRFRFKDNGLLNTVNQATIQISLQNVSGTLVGVSGAGNGVSLKVQATSNFRVICGPYYFWIVVPGVYGDYQVFAMGGCPWVPAFLAGSAVTALGYLIGGSSASNNTIVPVSLRSTPNANLTTNPLDFDATGNSGFNQSPFQGIINSNLVDQGGAASNQLAGWFQLFGPMAKGYAATNSQGLTFQFYDGSFWTFDPWVAWTDVANTNPPVSYAKIVGMLWDCVAIFDMSIVGDTTTTFFGHNWYAIGNQQLPNIWVATS